MSLDARLVATRLEKELRRYADPERAKKEKAYLKSDLVFLGMRLAEIRKATQTALTDQGDMSHDDLVSLVEELWSAELFERRMAAVELLESRVGLLGVGDLDLLERLVRESKTWALVDGIAVQVLGPLLIDDPQTASVLDVWAKDPDFWIRRASLIAYLKPLKAGWPMDRFAASADAMLEEKEFFIRKAIGWVLRETSKKRPEEVRAWIEPRVHRASGVTMREAVKYLDPPLRLER